MLTQQRLGRGGAAPTFFPHPQASDGDFQSPALTPAGPELGPHATPALYSGSATLLIGAPFTHGVSATALTLVIIRRDLQRKR